LLPRILFAVVATAALVACGGSAKAGSSAKGDEALPVTVVEVRPEEVRREVEAVGTLSARDETVISAEVEARVAQVPADMGDRVAAGTPLVVLDGEKLRYQLDEQRAELEQTRARLGARGTELPAPDQTPEVLSALARRTEAEQRLARARQLAAKSLLPAQELERAETELETARAAHESALASARNLRAEAAAREAALKRAGRELQDTVIRAPFDGVVAERLVSPGQFVRVQTPVMRMVRLHPLRLTSQIPEKFGPDIRVGHAIALAVDAYPGRSIEGRLTRISPDVDTRSRAFSIEGEVPNADGALKPGMFARVRILTDRVETTMAIPVSAVQTRYGRSVVFVVRDGKLAATEVKLGDRLGPRVEIVEGLSAGAIVVSETVEGLTEGAAVTPRPAANPTPGGAR
jgi:multidrug efflux pump subunit AcrA (membrane-fusion protein)